MLWASYKYDNAKRDRNFGLPDPNATVDTTELADKVNVVRLDRKVADAFHRHLCSGIYLSEEVLK